MGHRQYGGWRIYNRARHYQPWPQSVEQNLCYPISELVVFTFNSDLLSFTFSAISSPINKELTTKKAAVFFGTNLKSGSRQKVVLSLFRVASAPGTVSLTRACWKTAGGDVGLTHVLSSEIWDHNLNQAEPNTMLFLSTSRIAKFSLMTVKAPMAPFIRSMWV